jgi:hypothetical protein
MAKQLQHNIYDDWGTLETTDCLATLFDVARRDYKVTAVTLKGIKKQLLSSEPLTAQCIRQLNDMGVTVGVQG